MNAAALFEANLSLIDTVVEIVCRRGGVFAADKEDFASSVRIALMEDDYAILRRYEGRSSLAAYLGVTIQNLFSDERMRNWGRWEASAEAKRMGSTGILLERLLHRDGRSLEEALPIVRNTDPTLTKESVTAMAARLPLRKARPRLVPLDEETAAEWLPASDRADRRAIENDRRILSAHANRAVTETLAGWPAEDQTILRFRFAAGMAIADISRMLRLPQRPLYRRIETLLLRLRRALTEAGIDAGAVEELVGYEEGPLNFGLSNGFNGSNGKNGLLTQSSE
jgi:RNA polymerase sigma factor for flagellar operon FliA